jgi:hypothetical protein
MHIFCTNQPTHPQGVVRVNVTRTLSRVTRDLACFRAIPMGSEPFPSTPRACIHAIFLLADVLGMRRACNLMTAYLASAENGVTQQG